MAEGKDANRLLKKVTDSKFSDPNMKADPISGTAEVTGLVTKPAAEITNKVAPPVEKVVNSAEDKSADFGQKLINAGSAVNKFFGAKKVQAEEAVERLKKKIGK